MSSIGQAVGGVVGATIGFFATGGNPMGAVYGAQIGMGVGGLIDPPKGPNMQGPRLDDLSVQTSTYGANLSRAYGMLAIVGNIFWIEGDQLKETAKKTKQGGKGGGGGSTVTNYTYSATFAVGLCRGPITGVRRIWLGANLVYDAGATDIETIVSSHEFAEKFTLYLGTEDQLPDPRIQADKGAANVPAYRGRAYIVFNDLDLADYGNSLLAAQVKVEVTKGDIDTISAMASYYEPQYVAASDTVPNTGLVGTSPEYGQAWFQRWITGIDFRQVETYFNGVTGIVDRSYSTQNFQSSGRQFDDVGGLILNNLVDSTLRLPNGTIISDFPSSITYLAAYKACYRDGLLISAGNWSGGGPDSTGVTIWNYGSGERLTGAIGVGEASWFFGVADSIYALKLIDSSTLSVKLYDDTGSLTETIPVTGPWSGFTVIDYKMAYKVGRVIYLFALRSTDRPSVPFLAVIDLDAGSMSLVQLDDTLLPGGTLIAFLGSVTTVAFRVYNGTLGCVWFSKARSTPSITWTLTGNFTGTTTLGDIVAAECAETSILSPSDYDTTALTSSVRGYRVTQTSSVRAAIEPLQSAWPFDAIQRGYAIDFKPRGGSSVATIPAELLDARAGGDSGGVSLTVAREMDTQLPRKVSLKHLDYSREYDVGQQSAARINTDAVNTVEADLPIVLTAAEAAQKAEVLLYLRWMERSDISFRLPPAYLHLEPSDVITVTTSDSTYELRLTDISYLPDGRLECQAKFHRAAVYVSEATGAESEVTGPTLELAGPTRFHLLDVPALTAEMDAPAMLCAMTGYTAGWPGGILFRSSDGGQTWADVQAWTQKCTFGTARSKLSSAPPDVVDAAGTLQVDLIAGSLESVTLLNMLSGQNHFAYGQAGRWEIIAAQTCTLQADGSYVLRDFLRGRFGTEQHAGAHLEGDAVVHLNDPDVAYIGMDLSAVGLQRHYRGITAGRAITTDTDRPLTYSANNLKPLSPIYLNGSRHPTTNDWTLTWVRRTRVGGEWRDSVDAPLSETSEAYEIEIYASGAYSTIKRTLSSATATVAYTSADQVTDFGSNQATLYVKIYQISSTVGRGFPLTTSITR